MSAASRVVRPGREWKNTLRVSALVPSSLAAALACHGVAPNAGVSHLALPPTDAAAILAPGIISSAAPEFAAALTSDGSVLYFNRASADRESIALLESRFEAGRWSNPTPVSFASGYRDIDPFLTPAGSRLYFSSNRPMVAGGAAANYNTWYVEQTPRGWSEPIALEPPINSESQDVFASLDAANNLFFSSSRDGIQRIYRSSWSGRMHEPPAQVLFDINQTEGAGNPLITRDGRMLIFVSDRAGGYGAADLYVTCYGTSGWSPAVNLGPRVNSAYADFAPALTADGRYLLFTSERPGVVPGVAPGTRPPGDIYYVPFAQLDIRC